MHRVFKPVVAVLFLLSSLGAWAQNVTGQYRLDVEQDTGFDDCVWAGSLELSQPGANPGSFTGDGSATLITGAGFCADFSGTATGTIAGPTVDFGIGTGGFGTVAFNGTVGSGGVITGAWVGLGVTGTWVATPVSAKPVPLLPVPFLMILLAAVLGIGVRQIAKAKKTP